MKKTVKKVKKPAVVAKKAVPKSRFYVVAMYDGYDSDKDKKIEKLVGHSHGSGYGMLNGMRDMAWYGLTELQAKNKVKKLRSARLRLKLEIHEDEWQ